MRVTLREIARSAGVHHATASYILNGARGNTKVSEATRQRVLEAANRLGYSVNRAAQQLRTRRSHVIGLLVGDLENPFFGRMYTLCSEALARQGYDVVVAVRRGDATNDAHLIQTLDARQVDGLILWNEAPTVADTILPENRYHAAVVLGFPIEGIEGISGELTRGIEMAIRHLITTGRRNIGYLAPKATLGNPSDPRARVYADVLSESGFRPQVFHYEGHDHDMAAVRSVAKELVLAHPDLDALFCHNDMVAVGALNGIRDAGRRVPHDVALIGCDDLPLAAAVDVPITTIRYPLEAMCEMAVGKLLARLGDNEGEPQPAGYTLVPTQLIQRASSAIA